MSDYSCRSGSFNINIIKTVAQHVIFLQIDDNLDVLTSRMTCDESVTSFMSAARYFPTCRKVQKSNLKFKLVR